MKKHYFIVESWVEDGQPVFHIDHNSLDARFPDGAVWNEETQEWEDLNSKEDTDRDSDLHGELLRRLGSI